MLKVPMAIITIGGSVGAGKTTLANKLAPLLGYEQLYVGGLFREIAAERGMTLEDFYIALKNDPSLERSVDDRQKKLMREKNDLIVQGRMAWYFAKESSFPVFNIFLAVEPSTGVLRTAQRRENVGRTIPELTRANALRERTERERYKALYGVENFLDHGHYDFILDTTHMGEDEVVKKLLAKIKDRMEADA
jgi:predicted cytidylate kinase